MNVTLTYTLALQSSCEHGLNKDRDWPLYHPNSSPCGGVGVRPVWGTCIEDGEHFLITCHLLDNSHRVKLFGRCTSLRLQFWARPLWTKIRIYLVSPSEHYQTQLLVQNSSCLAFIPCRSAKTSIALAWRRPGSGRNVAVLYYNMCSLYWSLYDCFPIIIVYTLSICLALYMYIPE